MIKFKHKKHIYDNKESGKIVIYYNISDIFLGTALLILVVFFINDYLSHALGTSDNQTYRYADKAFETEADLDPASVKP